MSQLQTGDAKKHASTRQLGDGSEDLAVRTFDNTISIQKKLNNFMRIRTSRMISRRFGFMYISAFEILLFAKLL